MRSERGSIPLFLIITAVAIILLFVGIDACFEDEDEENDLGWVPLTELARRGDECRNQCGNEHPDCYKAEAPCSDDDFSPSFDKSPVEDSFNVTVCLPGASCPSEGEDDGTA